MSYYCGCLTCPPTLDVGALAPVLEGALGSNVARLESAMRAHLDAHTSNVTLIVADAMIRAVSSNVA